MQHLEFCHPPSGTKVILLEHPVVSDPYPQYWMSLVVKGALRYLFIVFHALIRHILRLLFVTLHKSGNNEFKDESIELLHRGDTFSGISSPKRGPNMSFFRSEEMVLCELFIQPEAAYSVVSDIGEHGIMQFRDLNGELNNFQRRFVSEVKMANEMERKLLYMEAELKKEGIRVAKLETQPSAPNSREIIALDAHLEKTEGELNEVSSSSVTLKSNFLELTELKHVLEKTQVLFAEQESSAGSTEARALIAEDQAAANISRARLSFVAGVIPRERIPGFETMLWRVSRGNVFLRHAEIEEALEDPRTGDEIKKNVFVVFFQGDQLKTRVKKICSGFKVSEYHCPETTEERVQMVTGVRTRLADLTMVLNQTKDLKLSLLTGIAKELQSWVIKVKKMKAVYHTMNMFNQDVSKKCLLGECWVPLADLQQVKEILTNRSESSGSSIPSFLNVISTKEVPPTFHRTNKFTNAFQVVIDAYGIATYREINPALFTIITFPFLFAVMFGDLGHGVIMTTFAAWMVIFEKRLGKDKSNNEIWNIFFGGRYLILLMGLFSMYTGLIYNDLFSKSINIFGSNWKADGYNESTLLKNALLQLDPADKNFYIQHPYPFGMDPAWQLAKANKIIFQNSFKMKLSIIIGVLHMIFGVSLSVGNHLYFKKASNIILEFVPQILFLVLMFFYMVVLMFIKWTMFDASKPLKYGTRCAPSVLITFINMVLFKENPHEKGCDPLMYPYQTHVNGKIQQDAEMELEVQASEAVNSDSEGENHEEEEEPMSEIFIHQAIHTIEYILSTVSHTASYLRLWALSLAHGQLSEVLWTMVFRIGLVMPGFVGCITIFAIFAVWATFTVAILVLMEGLSAFLHTLRLHWVEFMSKFYTGVGYAYHPFSFKRIFDEDSKEE
ncbi:hypothetical protein J437_LFUL010191 [Ladona fulva]|uniref:V-type proton ATPase subunit a n=1 Tax=Ladona fulva TaxID=123851 RepID=A0A8K0K9F3_LADFU|nr:hypothetical protein J437_LFUL010191 [Ladona fulva]